MTTQTIQALDKYFFTAHNRKPLIGRTWTARQFQRQFSRHFPRLAKTNVNDFQSRLSMVSIYTDLNKILRKRGMVIKSSNYYTKFTIIKDPENKVTQINHTISRLSAYRNDLNVGLLAYNNSYSAKLDATEIESIEGEAAFRPGNVKYGR